MAHLSRSLREVGSDAANAMGRKRNSIFRSRLLDDEDGDTLAAIDEGIGGR